jgi:hypothetical protein
MAAYVEAVERKLVTVSRGLYQFVDGHFFSLSASMASAISYDQMAILILLAWSSATSDCIAFAAK